MVRETIAAFKITEELFSKVTILSDKWLDKSIEMGSAASESEFNLGHVFRVLNQNDGSVFYTSKKSTLLTCK